MSEFVQVMKDWRRMCRAMDKEFGNESCAHCPLDGCSAVYDETDDSEDYAENERQIEAWAAEHPEPVYQSWRDFIEDYTGILMIDGIDDPIPADIAMKLGLKPKKPPEVIK